MIGKMSKLKISEVGEKYCVSCGAWCCQEEVVFGSQEELEVLGVDRISSKESGKC